jgi:hypothetical protein
VGEPLPHGLWRQTRAIEEEQQRDRHRHGHVGPGHPGAMGREQRGQRDRADQHQQVGIDERAEPLHERPVLVLRLWVLRLWFLRFQLALRVRRVRDHAQS